MDMNKEWQVIEGGCLEAMKGMTDNSVDAVVTDPPYGLSFMGKKWDYDVPSVDIWAEALRVLKPGGHLLAFAGTRTQHRMAVRIEDAGFEIRDMIAWVYGSGFPKSHNLKGDWEGWGTALKPALEPITVARKPFKGTVAQNVLEHGAGAMNIDGCRVEATGETIVDDGRRVDMERGACAEGYDRPNSTMFRTGKPAMRGGPSNPQGRWPANLLHDGSDEVTELFPETGVSSGGRSGNTGAYSGGFQQEFYGDEKPGFGDSGSVSRFFYCAKASKTEREKGLAGSPLKQAGIKDGSGRGFSETAPYREILRANHHPTVKPVSLMRYLARLVTRPGGVVLDPFCGSGSTGVACSSEGFKFIGIELDAEYARIARQRIGDAYDIGGLFDELQEKP